MLRLVHCGGHNVAHVVDVNVRVNPSIDVFERGWNAVRAGVWARCAGHSFHDDSKMAHRMWCQW